MFPTKPLPNFRESLEAICTISLNVTVMSRRAYSVKSTLPSLSEFSAVPLNLNDSDNGLNPARMTKFGVATLVTGSTTL